MGNLLHERHQPQVPAIFLKVLPRIERSDLRYF